MADLESLTLGPTCTGCLTGYHVPYFAAVADGTYRAHDLDVQIVYPPAYDADNVRAVAAGDYDVCLTSVRWFLEAKSDNPALDAAYVFMSVPRCHLAAFTIEGRPAAHGRPIESLADLDAASDVIWTDFGYGREYFQLLEHLGMRPGPVVELVGTDVDYPEMDALPTGKADVAVGWLDMRHDFERAAAKYGERVRVLPFADAGLPVYGSGIVAGGTVIRQRGGALRRLAAAVHEAYARTRSHPERAIAAAAATFPRLDPARALDGWNAGSPLVFDRAGQTHREMTAQRWQTTIAHHAAAYGLNPIAPTTAYVHGLQTDEPDAPARNAEVLIGAS
jgi:ABC-type nitrate/sulfonate/bicarbonate transport system substrate-binding protein